jgi:hypothetical protein
MASISTEEDVHARLLWKDGHHRKAIQTLEGAISANEATSSTSSWKQICLSTVLR